MISKDMARALDEMALRDVKHEYGWIITRHWDYDGKEFIEGDSECDIGVIGPRIIDDDVKKRLIRLLQREVRGLAREKSEDIKLFRMYTDDLEDADCNYGLVYEGYFWQAEDNEEDMSFRPLDDFGEPNYGCVHIKYHEGNKWVML